MLVRVFVPLFHHQYRKNDRHECVDRQSHNERVHVLSTTKSFQ